MCGLNVRRCCIVAAYFLCINIYFLLVGWFEYFLLIAENRTAKKHLVLVVHGKYIIFCILIFGIEVKIKTLMLVWLLGNEKWFIMKGLSDEFNFYACEETNWLQEGGNIFNCN